MDEARSLRCPICENSLRVADESAIIHCDCCDSALQVKKRDSGARAVELALVGDQTRQMAVQKARKEIERKLSEAGLALDRLKRRRNEAKYGLIVVLGLSLLALTVSLLQGRTVWSVLFAAISAAAILSHVVVIRWRDVRRRKRLHEVQKLESRLEVVKSYIDGPLEHNLED